MTARVLLVEEGWHATMYLATALEDAGYAVTVLTANGTTATCRKRTVQWISGPSIESADFIAHLDRLVATGSFDHVLPLTEVAMARLWDSEVTWSDRIHPATEAWQRALLRDKHTLVEHMAARGIAVPRHNRMDSDLDLDTAAGDLGFPLVLKGSTGCAGKRVRIVETRATLRETVDQARRLGGGWALQEHITGPTYLFGGLFHAGRPVRLYAAEKLEQHPPRTGGAIVLRSLDDAALIASGLRVMAELSWTGFASADFVRRPGGEYLLLEVNPRLWGSLAGAAAAGVDLFSPFAELLAGTSPQPDLTFAAGNECWIFPRYLNAAGHRNVAGVRRALRDLAGDQGRDWLDPVFLVHILRRLFWMRRQSTRI